MKTGGFREGLSGKEIKLIACERAEGLEKRKWEKARLTALWDAGVLRRKRSILFPVAVIILHPPNLHLTLEKLFLDRTHNPLFSSPHNFLHIISARSTKVYRPLLSALTLQGLNRTKHSLLIQSWDLISNKDGLAYVSDGYYCKKSQILREAWRYEQIVSL